jgi:hypothetical protein
MNTNREELRAPLQRFLGCFLATRMLEAIWVVIVLSIALSVEHNLETANPDRWKYWTLSSYADAGLAVLAWYYFGFAYIVVSLIASLAAWQYWKSMSARVYGALNLIVFCVHSGAVIAVVFKGHLSPAIWGVWAATVLYNAVVASVVWRLLFIRSAKRIRSE